MEINALPQYDITDKPTGCCPRFDPSGWEDQELHFQDKPFVRARTWSIAHIPINMGSVFRKTFKAIEEAGLRDKIKVMVGGAPVDADFADRIGADGYGHNAASGAELAKKLAGMT